MTCIIYPTMGVGNLPCGSCERPMDGDQEPIHEVVGYKPGRLAYCAACCPKHTPVEPFADAEPVAQIVGVQEGLFNDIPHR